MFNVSVQIEVYRHPVFPTAHLHPPPALYEECCGVRNKFSPGYLNQGGLAFDNAKYADNLQNYHPLLLKTAGICNYWARLQNEAFSLL